MKRLFSAIVRMSDREYRANLDGLNMFFGAVLGVVLSGTEGLSSTQFATLLVLSASTVVTILYVSASARRLSYAALGVLAVAGLPIVTSRMIGPNTIPAHLQPTLAVWLAFVILVEFAPREQQQISYDARSDE